ncbi:MAG: bifunctional DNA primase/polymerase, partial [Chloroflexota bacterium]|nr:bifunctional DNA primase/polymerase [Chloroflexota bacterium]
MKELESPALEAAPASELEIALAHAALGRHVFPFRLSKPDASGHRDKRPLVKWTTAATTEEGTIRAWAKEFPTARYGWNLEPGLVVVDIDDAPAFRGTGLELPPAPSQTTPSGGTHHLYQGDGVKQTVKAVPGLDTRVGGKGFVGLYAVDAFTNGEALPPPPWLLEVGINGTAPTEATEAEPITTRHEITVLMGRWRREGKTAAEIRTLLYGMYAEGTLTESNPADPWTKADLDKLAAEAAKWEAGEVVTEEMAHRLTTVTYGKREEEPSTAAQLPPATPGLAGWAYQGLAGELVDLVMPTTEGDPGAVLIAFLTWFGMAVGRGPYTMVGSTEHHANLYACVVGDTATARKGITGTVIDAVLQPVLKVPKSGASTGEGIIWHVRDPRMGWDKSKPPKLIVTDGGAQDKRLLIFQSEFGTLLTVMARPGNTLSGVIRDGWDGGYLSVAVKGEGGKYEATDAHIGILGNITREELA